MLLRVTIDCFVIVSHEPFGALTSVSLSAMSPNLFPFFPVAFLACKTVVFFANASDGTIFERKVWSECKNGEGMDHAYGASRLPKTTVLQSTFPGFLILPPPGFPPALGQ